MASATTLMNEWGGENSRKSWLMLIRFLTSTDNWMNFAFLGLSSHTMLGIITRRLISLLLPGLSHHKSARCVAVFCCTSTSTRIFLQTQHDWPTDYLLGQFACMEDKWILKLEIAAGITLGFVWFIKRLMNRCSSLLSLQWSATTKPAVLYCIARLPSANYSVKLKLFLLPLAN